MSEETKFLRAIQNDATDARTTLAYASWLEDRGEDRKAEYLRLRNFLQELPARLEQVRLDIVDRHWLHTVECGSEGTQLFQESARFYELQGMLRAFAWVREAGDCGSYFLQLYLLPKPGTVLEALERWSGKRACWKVTAYPVQEQWSQLRSQLEDWVTEPSRPTEYLWRALDDMESKLRRLAKPSAIWEVSYAEALEGPAWHGIALETPTCVYLFTRIEA